MRKGPTSRRTLGPRSSTKQGALSSSKRGAISSRGGAKSGAIQPSIPEGEPLTDDNDVYLTDEAGRVLYDT